MKPEIAAQQSAAERVAKLGPYRSIIDKYVLRFDDKPLRYPGGTATYGTRRLWMTRFIEEYVLNNGRLPDQMLMVHVVVGGHGYSGGEHDFSDLKQPELR